MCSCQTPDAVYYPVETRRPDIHIDREISPQEGLSDWEVREIFVDKFLGYKI